MCCLAFIQKQRELTFLFFSRPTSPAATFLLFPIDPNSFVLKLHCLRIRIVKSGYISRGIQRGVGNTSYIRFYICAEQEDRRLWQSVWFTFRWPSLSSSPINWETNEASVVVLIGRTINQCARGLGPAITIGDGGAQQLVGHGSSARENKHASRHFLLLLLTLAKGEQ